MLKIIAYLIVYNEADIIEEVVLHHINQGIQMVIIDNGSADNTLEILKRLKNENKILDYEVHPTKTYEWRSLINYGFDLTVKHNPNWIIHLDASTILESYDSQNLLLADQIREANDSGHNVINLKVYDFYPTEKDNPSEPRVVNRLKYYTLRGNLSNVQEKIFKYYPGIVTQNGHSILFPQDVEKKISPKYAIMRHYVFRSVSHGVKKILERKNRWNDMERKNGEHIHYDGYLGFEEEILIPSKVLLFKDEKSNWEDKIVWERPASLPSERYDIDKSSFFTNYSQRNSNICLVVGCQRSGTTLLRLILECHSDVICYEEPTSYDYWADPELLKNEIIKRNAEGKQVFVFKTPCLTEQFNNEDGIAKELRYSKFPFKFSYDGQLLLYLVRDPRDVCISLKNLKLTSSGNDWIDIWTNYIDNLYPRIIPDFATKYAKDLQIIERAGDYSFSAKAALYWKIKTAPFFEYDALGYKLLLVLYEDLITSPQRNIEEICKFLNIKFMDVLLQHHTKSHSYTNSDGITVGNTNVFRPIDQDYIRLYKNKMSLEEQKIILSIAGPLYKKIQYKWIQQLRNQISNY